MFCLQFVLTIVSAASDRYQNISALTIQKTRVSQGTGKLQRTSPLSWETSNQLGPTYVIVSVLAICFQSRRLIEIAAGEGARVRSASRGCSISTYCLTRIAHLCSTVR